jgi:hypothetical protein
VQGRPLGIEIVESLAGNGELPFELLLLGGELTRHLLGLSDAGGHVLVLAVQMEIVELRLPHLPRRHGIATGRQQAEERQTDHSERTSCHGNISWDRAGTRRPAA